MDKAKSGFHWNFARFALFRLWQRHGKNSVAVFGIDLVRLDRAGQKDRARERTVIAFDEMVLTPVLVLFIAIGLFILSFAADRQNVVRKLHLDFVGLKAGQIHLDVVIRVRFRQVD